MILISSVYACVRNAKKSTIFSNIQYFGDLNRKKEVKKKHELRISKANVKETENIKQIINSIVLLLLLFSETCASECHNVIETKSAHIIENVVNEIPDKQLDKFKLLLDCDIGFA